MLDLKDKSIVNYRKFIGYTQEEMAKYLCISVQSYRNKEAKRTNFNDKEKIKIKELFNENGFVNLTIDDIFFNF